MTASRLRWLPNALTVLRLLALPVLLALVLTADGTTSTPAAVLFACVAVTDFVDGKLARALQAETTFGRLADPLADRLLVGVGLVGLIVMGRFAWPGPAVILARDVLSVAAFVVLARRGVVLRVDMPGKVSSTLAMFGTGFGLLLTSTWVDVLFWVAVAGSVVTLVNYAFTAVREHRAAVAAAATSPSTSG